MYVSRDRGTRNCEFSGASEGGRGQIKGAHYLSSTWLRSTVDDGLESRGKFRSNKASSTLQNLGASQSGLRVLFGGTQASRGPSALPLCSEALVLPVARRAPARVRPVRRWRKKERQQISSGGAPSCCERNGDMISSFTDDADEFDEEFGIMASRSPTGHSGDRDLSAAERTIMRGMTNLAHNMALSELRASKLSDANSDDSSGAMASDAHENPQRLDLAVAAGKTCPHVCERPAGVRAGHHQPSAERQRRDRSQINASQCQADNMRKPMKTKGLLHQLALEVCEPAVDVLLGGRQLAKKTVVNRAGLLVLAYTYGFTDTLIYREWTPVLLRIDSTAATQYSRSSTNRADLGRRLQRFVKKLERLRKRGE